MTKYICDICKKEFGNEVGLTTVVNPTYRPSEFGSGFFHSQRSSADICNTCYKAIAEAQQKAIDDLTMN